MLWRKVSFLLPGIEVQLLGRPVPSLFSVQTGLFFMSMLTDTLKISLNIRGNGKGITRQHSI